jgi:hypothetical protein
MAAEPVKAEKASGFSFSVCLPFLGPKYKKKLEMADKGLKAANEYLNKPAKPSKDAAAAPAPAEAATPAGAPAATPAPAAAAGAAPAAGTAPVVADAPAAGAAPAADQAAAAPAKPVKTNLDAHKEDVMKVVDMASKFLKTKK